MALSLQCSRAGGLLRPARWPSGAAVVVLGDSTAGDRLPEVQQRSMLLAGSHFRLFTVAVTAQSPAAPPCFRLILQRDEQSGQEPRPWVPELKASAASTGPLRGRDAGNYWRRVPSPPWVPIMHLNPTVQPHSVRKFICICYSIGPTYWLSWLARWRCNSYMMR
jgi:hypothetical protein